MTANTKMSVYSACVLSTLLYGSETWTIYASQERKLNSFHMKCLRRIMGIKWDDYVTSTEVLTLTGMKSIYALLSLRRLRWMGHVHRMPDGRIPKDLLYGELAEGTRARGRPHLRYKDVCKRDLIAADIPIDKWEEKADDRGDWRYEVHRGTDVAERKRNEAAETKRAERKERREITPLETEFKCVNCDKDCHSRIGLYSHSRRCT